MSARTVSVRMYNVGFGDCFVVRFVGDEGESSVLIDCGTHSAGGGSATLSQVVKRVVADLSASGDPSVDVVVATHRHRDHVHGFRESAWDGVQVKEVWMPWTEHPTNPKAVRLREKQSASALALTSLEEQTQDPNDLLAPAKLLALNSLTNERAMRTLHAGFSGRPERWFLPTSQDDVPEPSMNRSKSFETPTLPGVVIHVLGPSRDERVIRDMNPPKGEAYLRLMTLDSLEKNRSQLPFARWAWSDSIQGKSKEEFRKKYVRLSDFKSLGRVVNLGKLNPYLFAIALEQSVNGTSLMLMFEFGDAFLLFPGDAQWGTWDAALDDPAACKLLEKTTFYKVGHHGSHNATPRRFVEEVMKNVFAAMVSVAPTGIASWSDIPKPDLIQALDNHVDVLVRSDEGLPSGTSLGQAADGMWTEVTMPARLE